MKKHLIKDIKLKSGITLPKGLLVEITPSDNHRVAHVHIQNIDGGVTYNIRYTSLFKAPSTKILEKWEDQGFSKTVTGKKTEPDGTDIDGFPSWLLALGYI